MKTIATAALLLAYAWAVDVEQSADELRFNEWAIKHNKSYKTTTDRSARYKNWLANDANFKKISAAKG